MNPRDEIAVANQRLWEEEVRKGCGYTIPWLDLDLKLLRQYIDGKIEILPEPLTCLFPASIFADVGGKQVLCLAGGGGQQSAVFSLLGARVTVVDLAEGQLAGDRKAAAHYGYEVTTVQADMRNLSCLVEQTFDLVFQPNSLAYIPDVREVYAGVARVLKPGGLYRMVVGQPVIHFIEWDGRSYCITRPYSESMKRRADGGIEFRHYMDDIFNGLLDAGFSIQRIHEAPYARQPIEGQPGGWEYERSYVAGEFAIIARKNSVTRPVQ
ncbi:MAG: class I SAM-dependent methyltransferase [Anaerolineae bacterium]|nr:class I SAM-dependent methyltransferase [Anaerolineae bacterium]